jgi:hypothetical protein
MIMADNNENKVLNVPPLRFPEFSGEWEKCKVSELLDFYSTNSLSWEQLEYGTKAMINLHYGLIHVGLPTMVDLTRDRLPNVKKGNMPKNFELCKEGDIAFADASEDTNEVAKAVEFFDLDRKDVVCGLHTIHGRDNSNQTVIGYKGYAFASYSFHKQIRRIAQGTKVFSISVRNFDEVYIGVPSKEEQTKIAKLLIAIDERIATQNKIIEDLKKLKSAIVEMLLCNRNSELLKLGDIGYFVRGLTYANEDVTENKAATAVIRANNLNYGNHVDKGEVVYVSRTPATSQILQKGDIVICMANGSSALVGKNSYYPFNDGQSTVGAFCGIYRTSHPLAKWLMQSRRYKRLVYQSLQGGNGAIANLNGDDILNMSFPVMEKEKSKSIIFILETIEKSLAVNKGLQRSYSTQKSHLLKQMFI